MKVKHLDIILVTVLYIWSIFNLDSPEKLTVANTIFKCITTLLIVIIGFVTLNYLIKYWNKKLF